MDITLKLLIEICYYKFLIDWLKNWIIDWLNDWRIELLIDWRIELLIDWLIFLFIYWLIDWTDVPEEVIASFWSRTSTVASHAPVIWWPTLRRVTTAFQVSPSFIYTSISYLQSSFLYLITFIHSFLDHRSKEKTCPSHPPTHPSIDQLFSIDGKHQTWKWKAFISRDCTSLHPSTRAFGCESSLGQKLKHRSCLPRELSG